MIVYSVDDRTSFLKAEEMLSYLKQESLSREKMSQDSMQSGKVSSDRAVILVANKVDLQRSRTVSAKGKYSTVYTEE